MTEPLSYWDKLWSDEGFEEPLFDKAAYEQGKKRLDAFFEETGEEGRAWFNKRLRDSFDEPLGKIASDMVQYQIDRLERIESERMQEFQRAKLEILAKQAVYEEAISHLRTGLGFDVDAPSKASFTKRQR